MKIDSIGDSRLRVWLSDDELIKWGIHYETLGEERHGTERLVRLVLALTQKRGHVANGRLMVEAIPVDGGCVLLLSGKAEEHPAGEPQLYRLYDLDGLFELAARWRSDPDAAVCSALYEQDGAYILVLYPVAGLSARERRILSEYAMPVGSGASSVAALEEYGRCLAPGGVLDRVSLTMRGSAAPVPEDRVN